MHYGLTEAHLNLQRDSPPSPQYMRQKW